MAVIEPIQRAFVVLEALNRRRSTTLSLLAAETGLPMRWMTTGQEVPADLAWAGAPVPQEAM